MKLDDDNSQVQQYSTDWKSWCTV